MTGPLVAAIALAVPLTSPPQDSGPIRRGWGPEQATGAPDTNGAGDIPTAWASRTEDRQAEWLQLEFGAPVVPVAVRVHETFNPGALVSVEIESAGDWIEVWSGRDPTPRSAPWGISVVPFHTQHETAAVRLKLDSPAVQGWNEIDAVGLVDSELRVHWAVDATASSTFARGKRKDTDARPPAAAVALADLPERDRSSVDGLLEAWVALRGTPDRGGAIAASLEREIVAIQRSTAPSALAAAAHGRVWLVVLEAPWQSGFAQEDFSFGAMLRSIFDHSDAVEVRQRFFTDAKSFRSYCREAGQLPGPVFVVVATHADANGLHCQQGNIPPDVVADSLALVGNLKLVHFSACAVMAGDIPAKVLAARPAGDTLDGVSGYDISVDWMASAMTEFLFFDLLLNRRVPAERAAAQLVRLLGFAGDKAPEGSPVPAAHFRFKAAGGVE